MDKAFEALYKELSEREPTRWELLELTWALKELAEAITQRDVWSTFRHIDQAQRYLSQYRGHFVKTLKLTEKEAELARGLHTYMRKAMDCPLGTILYNMISEDRGTGVWYAFVKGLAANKMRFREGMEAAGTFHETNRTTDNLLMEKALWMWEDDFKYALEWMKDDGEGEAGTA